MNEDAPDAADWLYRVADKSVRTVYSTVVVTYTADAPKTIIDIYR